MTVSEQIDALQAKVADLKSSLDASRHEKNEQIKARVASAKAKADAARETVHGKADQAADHAHSQWQSFKADASAKLQELQGRIDRQREQRDARAAEGDAEWAEDNASDALDTRPGPWTRPRWRCSTPPTLAHGPTRERQPRRPAEHAPGAAAMPRGTPAGPSRCLAVRIRPASPVWDGGDIWRL
jgi:hypothetical protein